MLFRNEQIWIMKLYILRPDAIEAMADFIGTDDPEILLDVVNTFLSDAEQNIGRMQSSLIDGNDALLYRAAHSLKSSSAIVGAEELSALAERLEMAMRKKTDEIDPKTTVELIVSAMHKVEAELRKQFNLHLVPA